MKNNGHKENNDLKLLISSFLVLITSLAFAQSPPLINYQGTARLADGTPLDNRTISVKFEILQGSASGTPIATESQTLQTNALGLFSTLIGQNTNLSSINWQGNSMFLRVGLDTSAGNSFVNVGVQQMVSVPYAIHASSVPSSYTNNILSIGSSTYALSPTVAVVPNTSITVSGLGTVTSIGTNTFDINIPAPTFSNSGQTIITGTYPDFVVNTPTVPAAVTPSITLTNTAALTSTVVSAGSSFSLNVPPPTFSNTSQTIITGTYPDFIVNTPTVGATPLTTVSPQGLVTVSNPATNSFVVGVPAPTLAIASGSISITGGNSVPLPAQTSVSAAGIATLASSGSNYTVGVPAPTLAIASGSISITGGNSIPLPAQTSVSAAGIATVGSSGSNYTVGVQTPVFTNSVQNIIVGTYPNYTVNTPTIANTSIALTATAAAGPSISTIGTNSFNINIPPAADWSLFGNAGTTSSLNFIGTIDNVALNFRVNNLKSGIIDPALFNTAFGYQSFTATTTGSNNAAFGYRTLNLNSTGVGNSAFGSNALSSVTSGDNNTAIGFNALVNNSTGVYNTAIGALAMQSRASGVQNVAVGGVALAGNASGNYNTALGYSAGGSNTGAANVFIGYTAGNNNTGSSNVFIGYQAGANFTGNDQLVIANSSTTLSPLIYGNFASGRVGIGNAAPSDILEIGSYNSAQDNYVSVKTAGSNSYKAGIKLTHFNTTDGFTIESNEIVNRLDFIRHAVTSATVMSMDRINGNIGIGSTSPAYKLDIVGTGGPRLRVFSQDGVFAGLLTKNNTHEYFIGIQGDYESAGGITSGFHIFDNTAGARRMVIDADGRMGVNESAPTATLHIAGTMRLVDGNQAAGKVLTSDGIGNATWQTSSSGGWGITGNAGTSSGSNFIGTTDGQELNFRTNNTLAASISTLGYLGIGNVGGFATTRLAIYGSESSTGLNAFSASPSTAIRIHNNDLTNNNFSSLIFSSLASNAANFEVAKIVGQVTDHTSGSIAGDLVFMNRRPSNILETMRIKSNGFVGIGTSAPATNLHINSTSNTSEVRLTHTATAGSGLVLATNNLGASLINNDNSPLFFSTNGATGIIMASSGQVGIGDFSTTHKLNVDGNISLEATGLGAAPSRTIGFPTGSTGTHGDLTIQAKSQIFSGTAFSAGDLILAAGDYNIGSPQTSGAFGGNVVIRAGHNLWPHAAGSLITFEAGITSATERMRIDGGLGRIGIGTTAPDATLTVNGTASKPGGGTWATFSDRRLKTNIHSYNDGLKQLMQIQPVWYTYTGEADLPQETFVGIIAQDLQPIAPYMVKETDRGVIGDQKYLSVDNSAMTYMLINSVKEQQEQIEKQQKQIDELKKQVDELLKK